MKNLNSEEEIRRLLKSAYKPVVPSPEFKERLFERLMGRNGAAALSAPCPLWERPKVWMPIAVAIISAVIGYGIWLSLTQPLP